MRTDSLIALRIGQDTAGSLAASLRPVLDRSLDVIGEALGSVESDHVRSGLSGRLAEFRTALASGGDAAQVGVLTHSCFDLCEQALQALQTQQHERRTELRRLVALVRDTVTMLVGDGDAFSSDI